MEWPWGRKWGVDKLIALKAAGAGNFPPGKAAEYGAQWSGLDGLLSARRADSPGAERNPQKLLVEGGACAMDAAGRDMLFLRPAARYHLRRVIEPQLAKAIG